MDASYYCFQHFVGIQNVLKEISGHEMHDFLAVDHQEKENPFVLIIQG